MDTTRDEGNPENHPNKIRKFNEGSIELVCEDETSMVTEIDSPLVKQSVVLQNMLNDLGEGEPRRCPVQCDLSTLTLVMRLMAADTSVEVDMTRAEMVVALRLMHFLDIPWAQYRHLSCTCGSSSSNPWDAPTIQAWVELVQMDQRAIEFEVYKSIWDPDASPALVDAPDALAGALRAAWTAMLAPPSSLPAWEAFATLFGRHGSDLLSLSVENDVWQAQEVTTRVRATTRWVCRAAGIARAEGTFEALAVEMLAEAPAAPEVPKVTWVLLQALALGAVREGLPRLVRAAATLLNKNKRNVLWDKAFAADFVAAVDLWDGVVGSDYEVFLRIKSPKDLVCLAVKHGHALLRHGAARKWLALIDRPGCKFPDHPGLSNVENLIHTLGETRLLGPRMPIEVATLVGSKRFALSTLRDVLIPAIGPNGLWYGFAEGMTVVLDAFRDRFRDPEEPDGDPSERQFLEDLLTIIHYVRTLDPPVAALGLQYVEHMFETTANPAVRSQLLTRLHRVAVDLADPALLLFHLKMLMQ